MFILWGIQMALNIVLFGLLVRCYRKMASRDESQVKRQMEAFLNVVEERAERQHESWVQYTHAVESQLNQLKGLTEQAHEILDRHRALAPTLEECDLKAVAAHSYSPEIQESVPKLKDLEEARKRVNSESRIDLKTILNQQLA